MARRFLATELPAHVIVFDTLEELVLQTRRRPAPLRRDASTRLTGRVVLAGRYDLRDRLPGFSEAFPDAVTVEVLLFDDDLAARYLTERRGVTRPDLVDAMVRRAAGPALRPRHVRRPRGGQPGADRP